MVLRRPSADLTPLSSGWTRSGFPTDPPTSPTPTSPKSTNTAAAAHPSVTYIDIQALITNNCSLLYPGRLTLATSHRDNTWTGHITRGPRILLSASGQDLKGALNALHRKSAEAIASRLVTGPLPLNYAEMESYSEDEDGGEEEGDEDEEDEEEEDCREEGYEKEEKEYEPFCGSTSELYPCCGYGPRTRTRLLPVTRPAPRQRVIPPPPPRTVPPFPPPEDTVPPPPRPPTSPCPPPAVLRNPAAP